jgi:hypothetical protein
MICSVVSLAASHPHLSESLTPLFSFLRKLRFSVCPPEFFGKLQMARYMHIIDIIPGMDNFDDYNSPKGP